MRVIDRLATEGAGPSLLQMMENAGRTLASLALRMLGEEWRAGRIVILAGGGGNGGGGICAGRHLANHGAQVILLTVSGRGRSEAMRTQHALYRATDGREAPASALQTLRPDLIIDALVGYSLDGPPDDPVSDLIQWANAMPAPTLSLDLPSGVDATTGVALGTAIVAHTTLTLALPKHGLDARQAGVLRLADLGIPRSLYREIGLSYSPPFGQDWDIPLLRAPAGGTSGM